MTQHTPGKATSFEDRIEEVRALLLQMDREYIEAAQRRKEVREAHRTMVQMCNDIYPAMLEALRELIEDLPEDLPPDMLWGFRLRRSAAKARAVLSTILKGE